ncbi:hypothetical protein V2G26_007354 [Clonostachys chloroleuca]
MGPFVNLDNMVTWTPPAVPGSEHADHAKQQTSISSPEPSFPSPPTSAPCDQVSHEPIYIPPDDENDTLPSIDTIFASIKKVSSVLSPTRSPNDANQSQLPDLGDAVIPDPLPETLDASCSESCEASNAVAISPQNGMEQTRDDSQSTLGSCSEGHFDSQSSSDSDGVMWQHSEDSSIPFTSLSLDIREKEEAYGGAEEAINDGVSQLLTGQLRCKGTHKDRFTPEQDPDSHCDSDSDVSSSSGSDAAVHDDEDYCPSHRVEREQASNNSVDEADRPDQ